MTERYGGVGNALAVLAWKHFRSGTFLDHYTVGNSVPTILKGAIMAKATGVLEAIEVEPLRVGSMQVWLRGITPLICNRLAAKARRELLCPNGRKSKAQREQSLKHDPVAEYRDSMNVRAGVGPTRIVFPAPAIKGSIHPA